VSLPYSKKRIGVVFYIDMENHNWTQPKNDATAPNQVFGCPAAPYINSLVTPGNPNAAQVSYCSAYHNVLAQQGGAPVSVHPSEPNYIWQENGSNLGIFGDNEPLRGGQSERASDPSLSGRQLRGQRPESERIAARRWYLLEGLSGGYQFAEHRRRQRQSRRKSNKYAGKEKGFDRAAGKL